MSLQLNRTENLFISKFIYKSTIEINELGTGALLIPKLESAFPVSLVSNVTLEFKANRPFLFIIHSKTEIISIGKYTGID
jgi:serine protease inhibitor